MYGSICPYKMSIHSPFYSLLLHIYTLPIAFVDSTFTLITESNIIDDKHLYEAFSLGTFLP